MNKKVITAYIIFKSKKCKKQFRVDPYLETRPFTGMFNVNYQNLRLCPRKFKNYFRMSLRSFDELLGRIEHKLAVSSLRRIAISPTERLAVTLR